VLLRSLQFWVMDDLRALIQATPSNHQLQISSGDYRDGFISAFQSVYGHLSDRDARAVLKRKFLLSTDSVFLEDKYLQGASELTVTNHIKGQKIKGFESDKSVNPLNKKDVDAFCVINQIRVSTEVKCASESNESDDDTLIIRTDGRIPDHTKIYEGLRKEIESGQPGTTLKLGKNNDNKFKTFLVEANNKFNPASSVDDLNVLLVACEDHGDMNEWYRYLYGRAGLFTGNPFCPPDDFRNVDVAILSNLKYRHKSVQSASDWSLENTLIVPFVNPHGRSSAIKDSILNGLELFKHHHLGAFFKYSPTTDDPNIPSDVLDSTKMIHYIAEHLAESDRARFFPTIKKWRA